MSLRQSDNARKHTTDTTKAVVILVAVLAFTLPIFRSGLKTNLTFVQWLKNHTVFGDPVEFIPREDYETELAPKTT